MTELTAIVLCLFAPLLLGFLLVQRIWAQTSRDLHITLGAVLGLGMVGTIYFLALLVHDSGRFALAMTESIVGLSILCLLKGWRTPKHGTDQQESSSIFVWPFALTGILGAAAFLFALDSLQHGGWDAFVMWNLRARLIAASKISPLSTIFDPVFLGLHPDYPLLLPSLVSRGFQYARSATQAAPMAIAALFTVTTVGMAVSGLRIVSTKEQSWIAGCLLVGTPFLITIGASQYADIVICCFMTAAIVLYAMYDSDPARSWLPVLAGAAAAAAACTKNEGILFVVILVLSRSTVVLFARDIGRSGGELKLFAAGASLGLVTLALFKFVYAPANDTIQLMGAHAIVARLTDARLNHEILSELRDRLNFGQWSVNPLPFMGLHAAVTWKSTRKVALSFTPAFVIAGMLCGYYVVYLLSTYDLESHVESSFDRLLLQLWPTIVVLYSTIVAPSGITRHSALQWSKRVVFRICVVLALVAAVQFTKRLSLPEKRSNGESKPHIELSRTEVTAGDTYRIRITGVNRPQVYISYSVDDKPMGQFGAYLGSDGSVDFQVSGSTPKGRYRFLAIRTADNIAWITFDKDAVIVVK